MSWFTPVLSSSTRGADHSPLGLAPTVFLPLYCLFWIFLHLKVLNSSFILPIHMSLLHHVDFCAVIAYICMQRGIESLAEADRRLADAQRHCAHISYISTEVKVLKLSQKSHLPQGHRWMSCEEAKEEHGQAVLETVSSWEICGFGEGGKASACVPASLEA